MRAITIGLLCLGVVGGSLSLAQSYRCDRAVVGIAGGGMSGTGYRVGATAGQTAAGHTAGTNYWALIGFWQPEEQTGVREEVEWSSGPVVKTRLYRPFPTPAVRSVTIRYTLDAERRTLLQIHDLAGRAVRTLCASSMKRGAYSVTWDGSDDGGHELARGVYFCRFTAGDYRQTEKVLLTR